LFSGSRSRRHDLCAEACKLSAMIHGAELRVHFLKSFQKGSTCENLSPKGLKSKKKVGRAHTELSVPDRTVKHRCHLRWSKRLLLLLQMGIIVINNQCKQVWRHLSKRRRRKQEGATKCEAKNVFAPSSWLCRRYVRGRSS
jgi:hypothetical protein